MDLAGGASWKQWKAEATASGLPLVPGEETEGQILEKKPSKSSWKKPTSKVAAQMQKANMSVAGSSSHPPRPKTGAAAILP